MGKEKKIIDKPTSKIFRPEQKDVDKSSEIDKERARTLEEKKIPENSPALQTSVTKNSNNDILGEEKRFNTKQPSPQINMSKAYARPPRILSSQNPYERFSMSPRNSPTPNLHSYDYTHFPRAQLNVDQCNYPVARTQGIHSQRTHIEPHNYSNEYIYREPSSFNTNPCYMEPYQDHNSYSEYDHNPYNDTDNISTLLDGSDDSNENNQMFDVYYQGDSDIENDDNLNRPYDNTNSYNSSKRNYKQTPEAKKIGQDLRNLFLSRLDQNDHIECLNSNITEDGENITSGLEKIVECKVDGTNNSNPQYPNSPSVNGNNFVTEKIPETTVINTDKNMTNLNASSVGDQALPIRTTDIENAYTGFYGSRKDIQGIRQLFTLQKELPKIVKSSDQ
ncbi:hypothetical protein HZS_6249, partial [Henneguya salminicola]